jgi:L-methionine (R)-S-oxide reductase
VDDKARVFDEIIAEIEAVARGDVEFDGKLLAICELLRGKVPYYNWVGFYLTDKEKRDELVLGPYVGTPTQHVRISFGRGICGRAARTRSAVVVQNVDAESDYLACSPNVKSEIVVPVVKDGAVWGEIDIDSHAPAPFTEEDVAFLKRVCAVVAAAARE